MTTPTLPELFNNALRAELLKLRVSLPAKVTRYDVTKQLVDVKPLLKKRYYTETGTKDVELPVITNVPVEWPATNDGKSFMSLPLKVNDLGSIYFTDRSIDNWLSGDGGIVLPNSIRHHDISDAVFKPGLRPFKKALKNVSEDNAIFQNDKLRMEIYPDGKISIEGATQEMLECISRFMQTVIDGKIITSLGPQGWIATYKVPMQQAKGDFDTLKI